MKDLKLCWLSCSLGTHYRRRHGLRMGLHPYIRNLGDPEAIHSFEFSGILQLRCRPNCNGKRLPLQLRVRSFQVVFQVLCPSSCGGDRKRARLTGNTVLSSILVFRTVNQRRCGSVPAFNCPPGIRSTYLLDTWRKALDTQVVLTELGLFEMAVRRPRTGFRPCQLHARHVPGVTRARHHHHKSTKFQLSESEVC